MPCEREQIYIRPIFVAQSKTETLIQRLSEFLKPERSRQSAYHNHQAHKDTLTSIKERASLSTKKCWMQNVIKHVIFARDTIKEKS